DLLGLVGGGEPRELRTPVLERGARVGDRLHEARIALGEAADDVVIQTARAHGSAAGAQGFELFHAVHCVVLACARTRLAPCGGVIESGKHPPVATERAPWLFSARDAVKSSTGTKG